MCCAKGCFHWYLLRLVFTILVLLDLRVPGWLVSLLCCLWFALVWEPVTYFCVGMLLVFGYLCGVALYFGLFVLLFVCGNVLLGWVYRAFIWFVLECGFECFGILDLSVGNPGLFGFLILRLLS